MEKQFVAEEPQQWLVPKRAQAISQGTGVRIIKATTPPALIAIPVGTLRKEIGVCLGHEDQFPISLLQGSYSACGTVRQGESSRAAWWMDSLSGGGGREHRETGTDWWNKSIHGEREENCLLDGVSSLTSPFPSLFILTVSMLRLFSCVSSLASFHTTLLLQKVKEASPCTFLGYLQL